MRLWATLARKCFFNILSFWTKDFPTFLDWSTGKLKRFTTMDHYRLSKVSNGQRQEWVKFLPVVEILGRTDPLWKLAECLHNPRAAFAQLALKSKLGDKMSFKGFWLTSALSSSLAIRWYLQWCRKKFQSSGKILRSSYICPRSRSTGLWDLLHQPETNNIELPSISVSSLLSKSPCTQRGRIHCNTLLCCRLGFWKRPFLAKHCLGSATDNVQQSHFDLWNVI